jgi:uncharacterized membrane protein YqjE
VAATPETAGLDAGAEAPRRSILGTWAEVVADAGSLLRTEAALARLETADNLKGAGRNALKMGAGLLLLAIAVIFLAVSAVVALAAVIGLGWALLAVALVNAAAGGWLMWQAQAGLADISLLPERTMARLSHDLEWLGERADRRNRPVPAQGAEDETT